MSTATNQRTPGHTVKTSVAMRGLIALLIASFAAVSCSELADIAGGSGSGSSPSASVAPAPDGWTGRVGSADRPVHLSVPEMDAVRFEIDTAGAAAVDAHLIAPSGQRMTQHDPTLIYSADLYQQVFWI